MAAAAKTVKRGGNGNGWDGCGSSGGGRFHVGWTSSGTRYKRRRRHLHEMKWIWVAFHLWKFKKFLKLFNREAGDREREREGKKWEGWRWRGGGVEGTNYHFAGGLESWRDGCCWVFPTVWHRCCCCLVATTTTTQNRIASVVIYSQWRCCYDLK